MGYSSKSYVIRASEKQSGKTEREIIRDRETSYRASQQKSQPQSTPKVTYADANAQKIYEDTFVTGKANIRPSDRMIETATTTRIKSFPKANTPEAAEAGIAQQPKTVLVTTTTQRTAQMTGPQDGSVQYRTVREGEYLSPSTRLVRAGLPAENPQEYRQTQVETGLQVFGMARAKTGEKIPYSKLRQESGITYREQLQGQGLVNPARTPMDTAKEELAGGMAAEFERRNLPTGQPAMLYSREGTNVLATKGGFETLDAAGKRPVENDYFTQSKPKAGQMTIKVDGKDMPLNLTPYQPTSNDLRKMAGQSTYVSRENIQKQILADYEDISARHAERAERVSKAANILTQPAGWITGNYKSYDERGFLGKYYKTVAEGYLGFAPNAVYMARSYPLKLSLAGEALRTGGDRSALFSEMGRTATSKEFTDMWKPWTPEGAATYTFAALGGASIAKIKLNAKYAPPQQPNNLAFKGSTVGYAYKDTVSVKIFGNKPGYGQTVPIKTSIPLESYRSLASGGKKYFKVGKDASGKPFIKSVTSKQPKNLLTDEYVMRLDRSSIKVTEPIRQPTLALQVARGKGYRSVSLANLENNKVITQVVQTGKKQTKVSVLRQPVQAEAFSKVPVQYRTSIFKGEKIQTSKLKNAIVRWPKQVVQKKLSAKMPEQVDSQRFYAGKVANINGYDSMTNSIINRLAKTKIGKLFQKRVDTKLKMESGYFDTSLFKKTKYTLDRKDSVTQRSVTTSTPYQTIVTKKVMSGKKVLRKQTTNLPSTYPELVVGKEQRISDSKVSIQKQGQVYVTKSGVYPTIEKITTLGKAPRTKTETIVNPSSTTTGSLLKSRKSAGELAISAGQRAKYKTVNAARNTRKFFSRPFVGKKASAKLELEQVYDSMKSESVAKTVQVSPLEKMRIRSGKSIISTPISIRTGFRPILATPNFMRQESKTLQQQQQQYFVTPIAETDLKLAPATFTRQSLDIFSDTKQSQRSASQLKINPLTRMRLDIGQAQKLRVGELPRTAPRTATTQTSISDLVALPRPTFGTGANIPPPPSITPPPPIGGGALFPSFGFGSQRSIERSIAKAGLVRYAPSMTAAFFKIKGKKTKGKIYGFELRPIPI